MPLAEVPDAIKDLKAGQFIILVDDEQPVREGVLCIAAEKVTADTVNFMARHGRGLICIAMTGERLDQLRLPLMVSDAATGTGSGAGFTVSVEAKHGTTTGISAADRARTIQTLINPATRPDDLARPGHMFPIRTQTGGVLVRAGHPEAGVDLAKLAGLYPAAVICAIMSDDGSLAGLPELEEFARRHRLKIISIEQVIAYRRRTEKLVRRVTEAEARLPTKYGEFQAIAYRSDLDVAEHVALVKGDVSSADPVLACVHVQCLAGDVFGGVQCTCDEEIGPVLQRIEAAGRGVLLYLRRHEIDVEPGAHDATAARRLPGLTHVGGGTDHVGLDPKDYAVGAGILHDLGIAAIHLLTDNPRKADLLAAYGIQVVDVRPTVGRATPPESRASEEERERLADLLELDSLTGL